MHVAIDGAGRIRQHGTGLGELDGCTVHEVPTEQVDGVLAALSAVQGDGGVLYHEDGSVEVVPPTQTWVDAQAARTQADADLRAAVAAHPDPVVRQLAARLGMGS